MMEARLKPAAWDGYLCRLGRAFGLVAMAAIALVLASGAGLAGETLKGELYMVGSQDSERIERVEFQYDGQKLNVASPRRTHNLRGSGDVQSLLDDLRRRRNATSKRRIRRVTTDTSGTYRVPEADSGAVLRIQLEDWEDVPERRGAAELPEIGGTLSGDDKSISHVAVETDGSAYYLGADAEDGGTFGEIDLETNTTTRLLEGLPAAADVADDPQTGELIVIGEGEIAQIQPQPEAHIVSRREVPPGEALESGAVDGDGHLFVRRTDGEIVFVDYGASGRIGAAENFTAAARPEETAAENGPRTAPSGAAWPNLSWLDILIVLAAILVLATAFFVNRIGRIGRINGPAVLIISLAPAGWSGYLLYERFAGGGDVTQLQGFVAILAAAALCAAALLFGRARGESDADRQTPDGAGDELVYSRWPEDWSQLKRLIDSMDEAERAELGGQVDRNPGWLDDAQALIRRPVQGGLSELRGSAAFGAALAGFAGGKARNEWSDGIADGMQVRIRHQLMPGAKKDWSRVIVEASVNESVGAVALAPVVDGKKVEAAAAPGVPNKKKKKAKKPRRTLGDIAADVGFFDIRWLFDGVARRIVADGAATRLDLDAAEGLRMPGDAEAIGALLEDVLRAALAAERRDGAAPPSLAVMAYEEKGEIHFIALRSGAVTPQDRPAALTGAALQQVHDAASKSGGRAWVEPGEAEQICRFTLAGEAAKTKRRQKEKRSGWRPAQPKAVWSMRSRRARHGFDAPGT